MNSLETKKVHCPFCGESIEVVIDCSIPQQNYIEDCQVCCRPINLDVSIDHDGVINLCLRDENE